PIVLEAIDSPEPVIEISIEPATDDDQTRLAEALTKLAIEDPSFRVHTNDETGQTIIAGQGELHLEIITDRLQREFKVRANVGKPRVTYRETISTEAEWREQLERHTGGRGMYADVALRVTPAARGTGIKFAEDSRSHTIP